VDWNYSGPAKAQVEKIDAYLQTMSFGDMTEEVKTTARDMCHGAIGLDDRCFPAYVYLGNIDWMDDDFQSMEDNYLDAIDRCVSPLDSTLLIDGIFETLYKDLRSRPENWSTIARLWERIQSKDRQFKSVIPLCIACRHSGDHRPAHRALDEMQRVKPHHSVKLARVALKKLGDPEKAVCILETHIGEHPDDGKAKRLLRKVKGQIG
jgi:hypothetical protein